VRLTPDGELVSLADQDRTLWDRALIDEATALLDGTLAMGRVGQYQIEAAIAAVHDRAGTAADTDWSQINGLYTLLERMTGNPIVRLNRAVATAMADGPAAGLRVLDGLDQRLAGHHRIAAVRAHLLEMAGETDAALEHYRTAARLTPNLPERRYLTKRAAQLRARDS
jgi:predicted RNA polymerase sigma factor